LLVALLKGLFNLAAMGLIIYLTYFFTMRFANRTPPPAPIPESQKALAKKAEDLRAQGKKLLSSYGWINPATKSVRIPIDRAMELIAAEGARPPAPAAAVAPVSGPVAAAAGPARGSSTSSATPTPAPAGAPAVAAAPPAAPPAPAGMSPEQIYRLVCYTCHDADGRGKIVRLAMPVIPDFTDPKWQGSRTDSELQHSILEGKESTVNGVKLPLMLPMKDKLALGHTDVKDMVAFVRGFKGGKQVVSLTPGGPAVPPAIQAALAPAPAPLVPAAAPAPVATPTPPPAVASSSPTMAAVPGPQPAGAPAPAPAQPVLAPTAAVPTAAAPTPSPAPASVAPQPAPLTSSVAPLPAALPVAAAASPARAEKLRAASGLFNTICIACHGQDGRGTLVRPAMPAIPDFTSRDWQTTRSNSQLATSILEGKGTLMPPWNSKVTADQARDLVLYVRSFGPPDLLAGEPETGPAPSTVEFDKRIRSLKQQFDEIERQLQALSFRPARP
jgi:mono/diheme cytochrome c family protein